MASTATTVLKNRIKTKLEGVSKIQTVYDKPQLELGGMPAATITPIGIERGDDPENSSVHRIYVFSVRLFYDVDRDSNDSVGLAVDALYDLADDVMDAFDDDLIMIDPTSLQDDMPTDYTFIENESSVGEWQQEEERSVIYLDITISSHVYKNIGSCT